MVLRLTGAANEQFGLRPIAFRVARVEPWPASAGRAWITGHELDEARDAVVLRTVLVHVAGVEVIT